MSNEIKITSASSILKNNTNPPSLLIGEWCIENSTSMIYASDGVGKSLLAYSLAKEISVGGKLINWDIAEARRVIYFDAEQDHSLVSHRLRVIDHNIVEHDNLFFVAHNAENKKFVSTIPILEEDESQRLICNAVKPGDVVFFDNITTMSNSDDSDEVATSKMGNLFLRLNAMGITVFIIHHSTKRSDDQRGSSKRRNICSNVIHLKETSEKDKPCPTIPNVKYLTISLTKVRHASEALERSFIASFNDGGWHIA